MEDLTPRALQVTHGVWRLIEKPLLWLPELDSGQWPLRSISTTGLGGHKWHSNLATFAASC